MSDYQVPGAQFTIREIIQNPKKRKETAGNELTALMADILLSHAITLQEWEMMAWRYWNRRYPGNPVKAAQEKTNAARALTMDNITWNRFEEFIQILGATKYSYTVRLQNPDGTESEHTLKMRNRYSEEHAVIQAPDDDDDDLKPVGYRDAVKALHEFTFNLPDLEPYIHTHLIENPDSEDE